MPRTDKHRWTFAARFRRRSFGWKSQPAVKRVREAVSEIKKVARKDLLLSADGAVRFLEKVSPALEQVNSSSGAIGSAVNRAIDALVPIIADAPADQKTRAAWLERLWQAHADDQIPYIESLADSWGDLCGSPEVASTWADELISVVETSWSPDPELRGFFRGTSACLSSLLAAGRHEELLALLEKAPHQHWHDRQFGVRALAAMGRKAEAIRYAEASRDQGNPRTAIARTCEEILLGSGLADEAYARYAAEANMASSYLTSFRNVARKYPHKAPREILRHLADRTPGEEGKWFAPAKDAGLYDEAIELARLGPCDPRTLTRAARDFAEANPPFAVEVGLLAFHWLALGYGYEITSLDVRAAFANTMRTAESAGSTEATRERIHGFVEPDDFMRKVLGRDLGRR